MNPNFTTNGSREANFMKELKKVSSFRHMYSQRRGKGDLISDGTFTFSLCVEKLRIG